MKSIHSAHVHAVVLLVGTLGYIGCSSQAEQSVRETVVPVKTAMVSVHQGALPIRTSGKLFSSAETKLSFKVSGIVGKILVEEGQRVRKGTILAQLDKTEIAAQVNQARNGFEKAKRDLARVTNLYADSVATLEQLQDTETAFRIAEANLKIAEFNLTHAQITAPAHGKILKRLVEANELVAAGMPAFLFGSAGQAWIVRAGVTDTDIVRVQIGDSAAVAFDAYPGMVFPATVSQVAEAANPATGTFEVELQVKGEGVNLKSGFVTKITIYPSQSVTFHTVPVEAVVEAENGKGYVYALAPAGARVRKLPVTLGPIVGEDVAIYAGVENSMRVITEGSAYLDDGAQVNVVE